MKFQKTEFNRFINNQFTPTQGYCSEHFGINKDCRWWSITHLQSGYLLTTMSFDTLKKAKQIVENTESSCDWNRSLEEIQNDDTVKTFVQGIEAEIRPRWS